jgi:predicted PurR-regulated permease PerM
MELCAVLAGTFCGRRDCRLSHPFHLDGGGGLSKFQSSTMARSSETSATVTTLPSVGNRSSTALALVLAIAALYVGREIFVPIALAVLLSFMLGPLVAWLRRRGLPRIPAVVAVVFMAFTVVGTFGFVVAGQLTELAENLPNYQSNIQTKIRDIKPAPGTDGLFGRISGMVKDLSAELEGTAEPERPQVVPSAPQAEEDTVKPIPVEIAEPDLSPRQMVETFIGPLIAPLVTFGIVIVFVIFILLQREDLRDRFIRLVSAGDLNRTTRAFEDAGSRVARYLLMQVVVNLTYGIPVGVGLWLIGVPNALLWGMLAVVLRFIPYVGPILAAMFPIALSIAVDPGWTMLLWTVGLFVILELVSNNVVEPLLYGAKTGLSPIAIIVAAIFWTWMWGPVGLLLSTPLTVCLVVLGRHVPQLGFLEVLLGSEPVLAPHERLYQRLLALDADEATEQAEKYLEDHSVEQFYSEVAVPALTLVELDRGRGVLDYDRRGLVVDSMLTLIDNLTDVDDKPSEDKTSDLAGVAQSEEAQAQASPTLALGSDPTEQKVLCFGARGSLDDTAALIAAQLIQRRRIRAQALSWIDLTPANLPLVKIDDVRMVSLSYLNESSIAHARYLVRRIRRLMPTIPIQVAFLASHLEQAEEKTALEGTKANFIASSLIQALDQISASDRQTEVSIAEPRSEGEILPFPDPTSKESPVALALGT